MSNHEYVELLLCFENPDVCDDCIDEVILFQNEKEARDYIKEYPLSKTPYFMLSLENGYETIKNENYRESSTFDERAHFLSVL